MDTRRTCLSLVLLFISTTASAIDDAECMERYDDANYPRVWMDYSGQCIAGAGDGPDDCVDSYSSYCDTDGDGEVDDDRAGVGLTVCNETMPCLGDGNGGTPMPCPCEGTISEPAGCDAFEISSPEPPGPGEGHLDTPPAGACDFYFEVAADPGGCTEDERDLLGGYHQTCSNVSRGDGQGPSGAFCDLQDDFRTYVDEMRYCLQEEVTLLSTGPDDCLVPGTTCTEVVDNIRDAHTYCNEDTDFCETMADEDAGWCFGYALGNAWGGVGIGTFAGGPTAPLGPAATIVSTCVCDDSEAVQDNICAGYREACVELGGGGLAVEAICDASCPDSSSILGGIGSSVCDLVDVIDTALDVLEECPADAAVYVNTDYIDYTDYTDTTDSGSYDSGSYDSGSYDYGY
jgi:hypothetical protein